MGEQVSMSLVGAVADGLRRGGMASAAWALAERLALLAVPLGEVLALGVSAFVVYALYNRADLPKHSAIVDGRVGPDREPPRDIMAPHFFQNRQGLWLHHSLQWKGEGKPVGLVVLLHGHSEHHRRFVHVAEHMNARGLAVLGMDHQGFGRSEGDRGHVERFEDYVEDVLEFLRKVVYDQHEDWRDLPRFLVAHSMGSLIAIHAALRAQASEDPAHKIAGLMLSAPALVLDPARNTWYMRLAGKVLDSVLPKAPIIGFPSYPSTSFLQVKMHATFDPLNYHGAVRVHQGLELLRGTQIALELAPAFDRPVLIVHGQEDLHASIEGSREFVKLIRSEDKTLMDLPDIRHEPWQEEADIREPVLCKVSQWALDRLDGPVPCTDGGSGDAGNEPESSSGGDFVKL